MLTKNFNKDQLVAFAELRSINQKQLVQQLNEQDQIGIVIKDKLTAVVIDVENYEALVEAVRALKTLQEEQEERELFESKDLRKRMNSDEWERPPAGVSILEWAGVQAKG